jgi:hypothetical protein
VRADGSVYSKSDLIKTQRAGLADFTSAHLGQLEVRVHGYNAEVQGSVLWKKKDGTHGMYGWSDLWALRGGSWLVTSRSDSTEGVSAGGLNPAAAHER